MLELSQAQARRIALAAQGFLDPAHATPSLRTFQRTLERTGVLQVDSVNVLQRAHYMPLYSRMGPYDTGLLERAASGGEQRRMVEYWAHVQAFMPVDLWPAMRHRMASYHAKRGKWGVMQSNPELEPELLAIIRDQGASTARELDDGKPRDKVHWGWNWSEARQVARLPLPRRRARHRRAQQPVRGRLRPARAGAPVRGPRRADADPEDAHRGWSAAQRGPTAWRRRAASATTTGWPPPTRRPRSSTWSTPGELEPARIEGWKRPAYLHVDARRPRRVHARALLSPFDPVVWLRERAEQLFDFHYRIEIYTPAEKRVFGYYVLPFLLGDQVVGRVDLKADRATGRLLVKGAYAEPHAPSDTGDQLSAELRRMAGWLGLDEIVVEPRGDLAPALRPCPDQAGP